MSPPVVAPSLAVSTRFTPRDGGGGGVGSWSRLPCGRPPFLVVPLPAVPSSSAALTRCHSPVVAAPPPHLTSSLASSVSSPPSLPFPRRRFHPLSPVVAVPASSFPPPLHLAPTPVAPREQSLTAAVWGDVVVWPSLVGGSILRCPAIKTKENISNHNKKTRAQTTFVVVWARLVCDAALTRSRYW
jgi:hypothetical protein